MARNVALIDEELTDIEHIRMRPGMYIGDTHFFGLIHYLVSSVNVFLLRKAERIAIKVDEHGTEITSDSRFDDEVGRPKGQSAFETFPQRNDGRDVDCTIINALSESLDVLCSDGVKIKSLQFSSGVRTGENADLPSKLGQPGTMIRFRPDTSIFQLTNLSSWNFRSYLRRLSFLHPKTRFSLTVDDGTTEYHSPGGIKSLFEVVSTPYQILHQPIYVNLEKDDFKIEALWAFQSWERDFGFSFINNGRAAEGGTHELGREAAFHELADHCGVPLYENGARANGIVYTLSVAYPGVVWQGCVKERVGTPELEQLVRDSLLNESLRWLDDHPNVRSEINEIRRFNFPDIWFQK